GTIMPAEGRKVSNIVMMVMGEPLYNFDAVKQALLIATDGDGLSLSRRRVTLSTSGVVPEIVAHRMQRNRQHDADFLAGSEDLR
ncbi:hypothetical protein ACC754_41590, partial [Rhizobium johnstonii]